MLIVVNTYDLALTRRWLTVLILAYKQGISYSNEKLFIMTVHRHYSVNCVLVLIPRTRFEQSSETEQVFSS